MLGRLSAEHFGGDVFRTIVDAYGEDCVSCIKNKEIRLF